MTFAPLLGKELEPVTVARDLGVMLDANLTFNEHIVSTVSSCLSRLGQINRVKHFFDKTTLIIIINVLVFSQLFNCSSVWSNTTQSNLDKLKAVQNFACTIVSAAGKFDHITPLLKDFRWLPVKQQLYFRIAVLVFKCLTWCAPALPFRQGQAGTRKCWEYHSSSLPRVFQRHLSPRIESMGTSWSRLKELSSSVMSTLWECEIQIVRRLNILLPEKAQLHSHRATRLFIYFFHEKIKKESSLNSLTTSSLSVSSSPARKVTRER